MNILDLLFPKRCVACNKIGAYVCSNCFARLSFDTQTICVVCGGLSIDGLTHPGCKNKYTIDGVLCGIVYKNVAKKLLYSFKYQPFLSTLTQFLTELLTESLLQQESFVHILSQKPVLIPISLSKSKLRKRGYNQSQLLATALGKHVQLEVVDCLERIKETKPQFGLKKEERKENIKNAFSFKNHTSYLLNHKSTAILVDDVLTTGSTLLEAAKVLKHNGFTKVYGVCFARDE